MYAATFTLPGFPSTVSSTVQDAAPAPATDYRLHLSDSLEIIFPFSPEFNQSPTVQPDGKISLREAEPVDALGATLPELEQRIAAAYRGVLHDPKISVVLRDFQRPSFYVTGEVGKPGRYVLRTQTSLLQALSEAGGLINERAERTQVVIFRPQLNGTYATQVVNVKAILQAKQGVEMYAVRSGDIIYIPQNKFSKMERFLPTASTGVFVSPTAF